MFSNLSKGSILHGIDKSGDELEWFTGTVERITPSLNNSYNSFGVYGQLPTINLDIVVTIGGKQQEFKGVHSDEVIADFGKNSVIIADSESALFNHVNSLLKTSETAVNKDNIAWHNKMIPQYKNVLSQMRPGSAGNSEVKELREQVGSMQNQIAELTALLLRENDKKEK